MPMIKISTDEARQAVEMLRERADEDGNILGDDATDVISGFRDEVGYVITGCESTDIDECWVAPVPLKDLEAALYEAASNNGYHVQSGEDQ
jgi:hypothetical protein